MKLQDEGNSMATSSSSSSSSSSSTCKLLSSIICAPLLRRPGQSLSDPRDYGVIKAQNCQIPLQDRPDEFVSAWFMVPYGYDDENLDDPEEIPEEQEDLIHNHLGPEDIAILYLHGNAETRSQFHRRELYKILQKAGFYVLAIDYRGFGDSSTVSPNEQTMAQDAGQAFEWLQSRCHERTKIVVVGHSLGTGVAVRLGADLHAIQAARRPDGYVLLAPFNTMTEEVKTFKVSKVVSLFLDVKKAIQEAQLEFESTKWIKDIQAPITILHSSKDTMVPIELGRALYEEAKSYCDVDFVEIDPDIHKIGHDYFIRDPDLVTKIRALIERIEK